MLQKRRTKKIKDKRQTKERGRINLEKIQSGEAEINEVRKEYELLSIDGGDKRIKRGKPVQTVRHIL